MTDNSIPADDLKTALIKKALGSATALRSVEGLIPENEQYTRGLIHGGIDAFEAFAEYIESATSEELVKEHEDDNEGNSND